MFEGTLIVSFKSPTHPSFLVDDAYRKRAHGRTRPNRSAGLQLSSALHESGKSPELKRIWALGTSLMRSQSPASPLSQPNTIGVIGGVSVLSTLIFLEKLAYWSSRDGKECLPFVACSDPELSQELSFHTPLGSPRSRSAEIQLNQGAVIENLRTKRNFLQQSGAGCLVMPCHISHAWHSEVSEDCPLPFLHIGDCVTMELKKAKLKPIGAASTVRIGVLTTDAILVASYYREKLQSQGFEVVLPDKATQEQTLVPAMEALNRKDMKGAQNLMRIAIQVLLVGDVNVVILASDYLQGLLPQNDPLLKKCLDPTDALARSTIQWAKSMEKVPDNFF
ncbi:hypothetical protein L6164_014370 [Bauhinia variegata]|uniref:Uncharacterized protein n=1 Tax=Bauhinia variegata TaxID=167791 RepID=A0ACB9NHD3_BAUVA|nr:hypothetical protein L6164_014370 [Bauhinia variegata]